MTEKTSQRRDALRQRLIEIAETRIEEGGLSAVSARDLAKRAGCSLGAIYTVFDDLNMVFMAVNGRTFMKLGTAVQSTAQGRTMPPGEQLIAMAQAYFHFARDNTHLWNALFDLQMTEDDPVPDWYRAALDGLLALITQPVSLIFTDKSPDELNLMTRALFSSVHGIISLGLDNRMSGVPHDQIENMISEVIREISGQK